MHEIPVSAVNRIRLILAVHLIYKISLETVRSDFAVPRDLAVEAKSASHGTHGLG